jgi:hypothetical protein
LRPRRGQQPWHLRGVRHGAAERDLRAPRQPASSSTASRKDGPADGVLKPGDEITALDGAKVTSVAQVTGTMAKRKIGQGVALTYKRGDKEQKTTLKTVADPTGKRAVVDIVLSDQYKFPFKIDISIGVIRDLQRERPRHRPRRRPTNSVGSYRRAAGSVGSISSVAASDGS